MVGRTREIRLLIWSCGHDHRNTRVQGPAIGPAAPKTALVVEREVEDRATVVAEAGGSAWTHRPAFAPILPNEIRLSNEGKVPINRLTTNSAPAPALDLAGSISPDWARDTAAEVAAAIPGTRWQLLAAQGHGAADEHLIPVLEEFLTPAHADSPGESINSAVHPSRRYARFDLPPMMKPDPAAEPRHGNL
jgi:hypothetical protein